MIRSAIYGVKRLCAAIVMGTFLAMVTLCAPAQATEDNSCPKVQTQGESALCIEVYKGDTESLTQQLVDFDETNPDPLGVCDADFVEEGKYLGAIHLTKDSESKRYNGLSLTVFWNTAATSFNVRVEICNTKIRELRLITIRVITPLNLTAVKARGEDGRVVPGQIAFTNPNPTPGWCSYGNFQSPNHKTDWVEVPANGSVLAPASTRRVDWFCSIGESGMLYAGNGVIRWVNLGK